VAGLLAKFIRGLLSWVKSPRREDSLVVLPAPEVVYDSASREF
jgi:hypothetical protein